MEKATFGGGCFWCTEAVFKRVKGVLSVTSGYAGGKRENPTYNQVASGATNHAESIQIEFDPSLISFEHLLDIFWATHNPTELDKQGYDIGSEYRSVIFYHSAKQKTIAEESKEKISKSYQKPIVTEIVPFTNFYKAEDYHQDYYEKNKDINPYCSIVINPKIEKLIHEFNDEVKEEYK
jgi:peptide-methionine (S)-S-oxide reductase